jgi:DNA-binding MarR family transcriptional regulator
MKRTHPHSAYEVDEIATALNLTKSGTRAALKKLEIDGWVRRIDADQGTLWMFYDLEL